MTRFPDLWMRYPSFHTRRVPAHDDGPASGQPVRLADGSRVRGLGVVVDEHEERDVLVGHERRRVAGVTGADGDHVGTQCGDLGIRAAQLRRVRSAVQSTEMAEEDHDHGALRPDVAEPMRSPVGAGELDRFQRFDVHGEQARPRFGPRRLASDQWETCTRAVSRSTARTKPSTCRSRSTISIRPRGSESSPAATPSPGSPRRATTS